MASHDSRPLPDGWIEQYDSNHQRTFWVDTKATPPRSIWTHPLDDPEYQSSQRGSSSGYAPPPGPPPSHHSSNGYPTDKPSSSPAPPVGSNQSPAPHQQQSTSSYAGDNKKSSGGGLFGKLKSKLDSKMSAQGRPPQQYAHQQQGYAGQPMYGQPQQPVYGGGDEPGPHAWRRSARWCLARRCTRRLAA
ncbi:hypothetical protein AAT19DRAFT_8390 [Rhodotorula toruloides]|uniref:Uncharacterized protein n=1 Tax=Rhodotorula toruloides TaxID=5286 RepID=A0A2T0AH50_RHOTO|nr:hypothetical protein AAT19DRAFT_8390 [Rhodotorula toruloides]